MEELRTELIPAREEGSTRLLIALHGLGDSMEGYRDVPHWLQVPWLNFLLVNAPDPYYSGFSWYDFAGNPEPGIRRSRNLLLRHPRLVPCVAKDLTDHRCARCIARHGRNLRAVCRERL